MEAPTKKRATYQDVLDAPEHLFAEILNGELILSPHPRIPELAVTSALGGELIPVFDRPSGWFVLDWPELHHGDDVVVPDLAGWRRERMPMIPDAAFFTLAPDWVCEVLSESTETHDRAEKLPLYAAYGVRVVWFVSARNRMLEVFRLHDGKWLLVAIHVDDQRVRAEPFDAFELDLGSLWRDLPPPVAQP